MEKRILFIFIVIVLTVTYSIYQKNTLLNSLHDSSSEFLLTKLPDVNFQDLSSNKYDVKSKLNDETKIVFIHFWGTWCAPCEAELPDLILFAQKYKKFEGVKFLFVAVNDDPVKVRKHIQKFKDNNLIWLIDNDNVYKTSFGSVRVPESYIFGKDYQFLKKFIGPQDWDRDHYSQLFQEFLEFNTNKL